MYPRGEAIYISPNEAALDNAYQYQPVDRGMGFALGLFSTLVNVGLQLTMATIQTVSTIHQANVSAKAAKEEEHAIERAEEAERLAKEAEAKKYADMLAKLKGDAAAGESPATGGTLPASAYLTSGIGGINTNTLLIAGAIGVAAILILKKRS